MKPGSKESRSGRLSLCVVTIVLPLVALTAAPTMALTDHVVFSVNGDTAATTMVQGDELAWGANCSVGATMAWGIWYDVDNDGSIDTQGDVLIAEFLIADGDTSTDGPPPDSDPTPDGFFMTPPMNLGIAPGKYIFVASDMYDKTGASKSIVVSALPSPPNSFSGTITIVGHSAPDPALQHRWVEADADNGSMWSAMTDANGAFTINVGAAGTDVTFYIRPNAIDGYVTPSDQSAVASGHKNISTFAFVAPADSVFGLVRDENSNPLQVTAYVYAFNSESGMSKNAEAIGGSYVMYFGADELGEWQIGLSQDGLIPDYVVPGNVTVDNSSTHGIERDFVCRTADTVIYAKVTENGGTPSHHFWIQIQNAEDNSFTFSISDTGINNVVPLHITSYFDSGWNAMISTWDTAYAIPDGYITQGTHITNLSPGDTAYFDFVSGNKISDTIQVDADDPMPNPDSVQVFIWNYHGGNYQGAVDSNGVYTIYCDTGSQFLSVSCSGYTVVPQNRTVIVTGDSTGGLGFYLNKTHARIHGTLTNVPLPLPPFTGVSFSALGQSWWVAADQQTGAYSFDCFDADWTITPPTLPDRTTPNQVELTIGEAPDSIHQVDFNYSLIADVGDQSGDGLPQKYMLGQNYPNPFNPSTTIYFDLPRPSDVKIIVYNLLGQEVATLVNTRLSAGRQKVVWTGRDSRGTELASGIFFYKLVADNFSDTKKMLLLR